MPVLAGLCGLGHDLIALGVDALGKLLRGNFTGPCQLGLRLDFGRQLLIEDIVCPEDDAGFTCPFLLLLFQVS